MPEECDREDELSESASLDDPLSRLLLRGAEALCRAALRSPLRSVPVERVAFLALLRKHYYAIHNKEDTIVLFMPVNEQTSLSRGGITTPESRARK